jgi:hypothetical protein
MADTKRLVIQKALTDLLKTIQPPAYENNLSVHVYRGRYYIGETEPLPMINIVESFNPDREPGEVGGFSARNQKDKWILLIQGWTEDDKKNPTDPAHLLMGEVKKCLAQIVDEGSVHFCLGGLVAGAVIEPGTVRPPDDTSPRAYFWLRLILEVTEKLIDPFDLD